MAHDRCNCYISFWVFFCPFTAPKQPKKSKFYKNEKTAWRYHHFTFVDQKLWSDDVQLLRYGAQWMDRCRDGQTDWWTEKWYIDVGAPPKNQIVNKLISFQKILKELIRKNIYTLLKQVIFAIVFLKVNVIHKITALSTLNC